MQNFSRINLDLEIRANALKLGANGSRQPSLKHFVAAETVKIGKGAFGSEGGHCKL
jgi:hypothetical protein